jgi:hypothetical protein
VTVATAIDIALEVECPFDPRCGDFASPLLLQLRFGYEECSVLPIPTSVEEWASEHRTARKRASRASNRGYIVRDFRREEHEDEIYAINTSLAMRQGRPMSYGYIRRPSFSPLPDYPCPRHGIRTLGVFDARGTLVAYLFLYRAGDLALVSSILGHGDNLADDVMYLLFRGIVEREAGNRGFFVYNRHDSGTEGLRYFKSKLGFEPQGVEWRS